MVVAVGIIVTLSSIGTLFYLKYYEKGKFTNIHQTAESFFTAVQLCLLKHDDDATKCDTLSELKIDCDYCDRVDLIPNNPLLTDPYGDQIRLFMEVGEFESIATYRTDEIISHRICIRSTLNSQKFCAFAPSNRSTERIITTPVRKCAAATDCETGQFCEHFNLCVI